MALNLVSKRSLRLTLVWLLCLILAASPASAQILPPPNDDPPPEEESDTSSDDSGGGIFDSLDSGDTFNSGNSDSGDSDVNDLLLFTALVTLVVGGIYLMAAESRDKDRVASHAAAEAMKRLRKIGNLLEESASNQSPLTVLGQRPADAREILLTPEQRRQASIVTASTSTGEQLAFTVDRVAAERVADGPIFVQSMESGWQITSGVDVLSFVPNPQLVKLTGHRPLNRFAAAPQKPNTPH